MERWLKHTLISVLLLFIAAFMMFFLVSTRGFSQEVFVHPASFNVTVQTLPAAIPTSRTCLVGFASSCAFKMSGSADPGIGPYLCGADFAATGQTVTLSDVNTIPWIVAGGVLGSGGNPTGWSWTAPSDSMCRWFPSGIYIQSNGAGVTGTVVVKYNH